MTESIRKRYYKTTCNSLSRIFGTPPYIIFFVSHECPNNCLHCWYKGNWKKKNVTRDILTFDEIEKIAQSIKYIQFITLTGGEAFLRPEIVEIIKLFNINTKLKRCDIPTSGFNSDFINEKVVRILETNTGLPFRVDVSIDGIEEKHDIIRQNSGLFNEACKTINSLKKIKEKYPNFDLSIITTVSEYNNSEIESIGAFIEKILPDGEWMVNIERPPSKNPDISLKNLEAYNLADDLITLRIKRKIFSGDRGHNIGKLLTIKNSLRRSIISDILQGRRLGGGCSAGSLIGAILNDGEVRPCEMYDLSIGNIRDYNYNLKDLWNSVNAIKIRNKIQDDLCICTNECFWSTNTLIQPSCWKGMIQKFVHNE